MAKEQRRSNREIRKPKKKKEAPAPVASGMKGLLSPPAAPKRKA